MTKYKDADNKIYDDMDGAALLLPNWPEGLIEITEAEAQAITAPTLLEAQEILWGRIKTERERRTLGGFYEPVSLKWFHSDSISSKQQLALVIMGAGVPVGLQWKTMDGSFVEMTQALAGQVFAAAAVNDQAVFAAAEVHKAAMLLEADPLAYDFSTGWPLAYGE